MAGQDNILSILIEAKDMATGILQKVQGEIGKTNEAVTKSSSMFGGFGAAIAGIGAALSAAGIVAYAKSSIDAAVELGTETTKLTRMTGMTAESASELIAVAHRVGISFDDLSGAVVAVSRKMGALKDIEGGVSDASGKMTDVFEKFHITIKNSDGTIKPFSEIFEQIRDRIQGASNQTEKLSIATQFFRGSAAQMLPLLTMSKERYAELAEEARKYGLVLSADNLDKIKEYKQAHKELDEALKGAKVTLGLELMPALTELTKWVVDNLPQIKEWAHAVGVVFGGALTIALGIMHEVVAAGFLLASALYKVAAAAMAMTGNFDMAKGLWEVSNNMMGAAGETAKKGVKILGDLGSEHEKAGKAAKTQSELENEAGAAALRAAEQKAKATKLTIEAKEREQTIMEALMNLEIQKEQARYNKGEITLAEYLRNVETLHEANTNSLIALNEMKIEAIKKDPTITNEEEKARKIAEIDTRIVTLKIKSASDQQKLEEDLFKNTIKTREDEFNNWKNIEELKIQGRENQLKLEAALDDEAVKNGYMRESQKNANDLARWQEISQSKIDLASVEIQKIEAINASKGKLDEKEIEAFRKLKEAKETLLNEYAIYTIQKEQEIAEKRKKEQDDAQKLYAETVGNAIMLAEMEKTERLKKFKDLYAESLISSQQFNDAKVRIEAEAAAKIEAINKQSLQQYMDGLSGIVTAYNSLFNDLKASLTSKTDFSDMKKNFRDTTEVLKMDARSMNQEITQFAGSAWKRLADLLKDGLTGSADQVMLYGKNVTNMSLDQVRSWASKVKEFVQEVQNEFLALTGQISALKDELDQMHGNELPILERKHTKDLADLKEKYGLMLQDTKEYREAEMLINQVFDEKKKKLEEQALTDKKQKTQLTMQSLKDVANVDNLAAKISGGFASNMTAPDINIAKNMDINSTFEIKSLGPEATKNWIENEFWPIYERKLQLKGRTS